MLVFSLAGMQQALAQTCNPGDLGNQLISSFHQSVAQKQDGSWAGWGQALAENGASELSPVDLANPPFDDLPKVLLATTGSITEQQQTVAVTVSGLYVWGSARGVIPAGLSGLPNIKPQKVNTGTDGLPTGVAPTDVKQLYATSQTLALVTNSGALYMMSSLGPNYGTPDALGWHQVTLASGVTAVAVRGQANSDTRGAMIALGSDGKLYTWGPSTYLGDGSAVLARTTPTAMTLPGGSNGTIKQIAVTGNAGTGKLPSLPSAGGSTYFVLYNDGSGSGKLFALGYNDYHQVGDRTNTERLSWVPVLRPDNTAFDDVAFISAQEHTGEDGSSDDRKWALANALLITKNGALYNWGQEDAYSMLNRGPAGSYDPGKINATEGQGKVLTAEMGGHTMVFLRPGETRLCYSGHKKGGSMGDGTNINSGTTPIFTCDGTPALDLCTPLFQEPKISLGKEISNGPGPFSVSQTIQYGFLVKNTGNVTLDPVALSDNLLATAPSCPQTTLTPGEAMTCTGSYVVQDTDGASTRKNTATATGTPPTGPDVSHQDSASTKINPFISAVNDNLGTLSSAGGTSAGSVLQGDKLNGNAATTSNVDITTNGAVTSSDPGATPALVTLDTATGQVKAAPGAQPGTYQVPYKICQKGGTTLCATAVATVKVDPSISAADDNLGTLSSAGGTSAGSVLQGDKLNGNPASTANVNITANGAASGPDPAAATKVTLDTTTGKVNVAAGTQPGTYQVPYKICDKTDATLCATAVATVKVDPSISAADDNLGSVSSAGGTSTDSVLQGDKLNGNPASTANVNITANGAASGPDPAAATKVTLDTTTGKVNVAAGTQPGTYQVPYKICDKTDATLCATAVATVTVGASIEAVDDNFGKVLPGGATPSVLTNDKLNGVEGPSKSQVDLSLNGSATGPDDQPTGDVTLNADGTITVVGNAKPGEYKVPYKICIPGADPKLCSEAVATVTVMAVAPIPTLSQWGLVLLGSLLTGVVLLRRRATGRA